MYFYLQPQVAEEEHIRIDDPGLKKELDNLRRERVQIVEERDSAQQEVIDLKKKLLHFELAAERDRKEADDRVAEATRRVQELEAALALEKEKSKADLELEKARSKIELELEKEKTTTVEVDPSFALSQNDSGIDFLEEFNLESAFSSDNLAGFDATLFDNA